MNTEPDKWLCDICYAKLQGGQLLAAPHPFEEGATIFGCPECREAGDLTAVCDEPGCWNMASCGNPTLEGYRVTCHQHQPK